MRYSAACQCSLERLGLVTTLLQRAALQCFVGYTVGDVCVCVCGWKEDRRHAREMHGKNNLKQGDLKMEKR